VSLHEDLTIQEMEANGEMDFIRSHVAAAQGGETEAPAPEADTVTSEEGVEQESEAAEAPAPVEDSTEEEVPTDVGIEGEAELTPEEEEVLYLELDDDTQSLIDQKYGGDVSKALSALKDSQSLIGRQGNELGELRRELQAFQQEMRQQVVQAQPYPEWPDEYTDGPEAAAQLREVAEAAFVRGDVPTFQRALQAWEEADRVSAANYRDLKEMQIAQSLAAQAPGVPQDEEATLQAGLQEIRTKYPQLESDASFKQAVSDEIDKTPSLKRVLWEGVPGVTPQERLLVLEEAAQRVAARTTSETAQQARRRIAIRTSEEARVARAEAQVARPTTAREEAVEQEGRKIPMGDSGKSLDLDRLNAMLPESDRL